MNILIILTSFNSLILVGFVVLLGGALYMEQKKNKERLGIKNELKNKIFNEFEKQEKEKRGAK